MYYFFKFFMIRPRTAAYRRFTRYGCAPAYPALLLAAWLLFSGAAWAGENGRYEGFQASGDIRRFAGETLYFDISFLMFNQAATAEVRFFEKNGVYRSRLVAQTKGFIGLVTSYRQHTYEATFDVIDGGRRLRAVAFLRQVVNGDQLVRTEHTFDYKRRLHRWTDFANGKKTSAGEEVIPDGVPFDDVLTAFYNFRNGVYGPVKQGAAFSIHTVPEKGHDTIEIAVHSAADEENERQATGRNAKDEFLIDIKVPKEIFNTETGRIRLWSSRHLIPVESIIEDVILLGDLHANFNRREIKKPGASSPAAVSVQETGVFPAEN